MLGGMGNPIGAVVGGLLLGLIEAFGAGYSAPPTRMPSPSWSSSIVLFAAPQGLFGRRVDGEGVRCALSRTSASSRSLILAVVIAVLPFFFPSSYYFRVASLVWVSALPPSG